jgi:hypothetical protein
MLKDVKIPLAYQRTEYDCGPTSLLNAISYLFPRSEIPPDILRYVMTYTLDNYNLDGEEGKEGTSLMAMMFLSSWLNKYAKAKKLPLTSEYLSENAVKVNADGRIVECLLQGGVVVLRLMFDCEHYVTLTGVSKGAVEMFDPYYQENPRLKDGVEVIRDRPCEANRRVDFSVFTGQGDNYYTLGKLENREAVLLFNDSTRRMPDQTIEYFL